MIRLSRRSVLCACAVGAAALTVARDASADDCGGTSLESVADPKATHKVSLSFNRKTKRWDATIVTSAGARSVTLDGPNDHAHLVLAVVRGADRFALVEAAAGHERADRVRVYDTTGKLRRAISMDDILTKAEQKQLTASISHLQWLAKSPGVTLGTDGTSIGLQVIGGRTAPLDLR